MSCRSEYPCEHAARGETCPPPTPEQVRAMRAARAYADVAALPTAPPARKVDAHA
jgi:hypothetical protein